MSTISCEEKVALHQLALKQVRDQLQDSSVPMVQLMISEVDQLVLRMQTETDGSYIKRAIQKLDQRSIMQIKEKMRGSQVSERNMYQYAEWFFAESKAIESITQLLNNLSEVVKYVFWIQTTHSFWSATKGGNTSSPRCVRLLMKGPRLWTFCWLTVSLCLTHRTRACTTRAPASSTVLGQVVELMAYDIGKDFTAISKYAGGGARGL